VLRLEADLLGKDALLLDLQLELQNAQKRVAVLEGRANGRSRSRRPREEPPPDALHTLSSSELDGEDHRIELLKFKLQTSEDLIKKLSLDYEQLKKKSLQQEKLLLSNSALPPSTSPDHPSLLTCLDKKNKYKAELLHAKADNQTLHKKIKLMNLFI
jgi:hypothetical protein